MSSNSGYRVNEDGSVTRISGNGSSNNSNNTSNGSSGNGGCIWGVIIAIAIIVIVIIVKSNSSGSYEYDYDDTIAVEEAVVEEVVAVEEVVTPSTTYLRVSDDDIYMNAQGGSTDITIYTDGDWYVSVNPESWGHISKYSNSLTLRLDRNPSNSSRTDYFEIKSGDYSRRISITQYGNTNPSANIERVWVDHNVYQNGYKGMKIHVKFSVDNMNGKTIYGYVYIYYGDNVTPLHGQYGNNLSFYGYGTPNYDSARFDDFSIFIPYTGLNMQPGSGSTELSFDVSIRTAGGTELDRDNNTQFTYTQS